MKLKEWKRKELFHLLTEKFGLKEFQIVGGFGDEELPFSLRGSNAEVDMMPKDALNQLAGTDIEEPEIEQPEIEKVPEYDSENNFEDVFSVFKQAIANKESNNDYNAVGVPVRGLKKYEQGEQARGKYQIMPTNWRAWSKAAGLSEEFQDPYADGALSPENQEKVADYQFRYYYNKYDGDWKKVAIAWYGGEGGVRKVERGEGNKPVYHPGVDKAFPSIASYGEDVVARMEKIRQGK